MVAADSSDRNSRYPSGSVTWTSARSPSPAVGQRRAGRVGAAAARRAGVPRGRPAPRRPHATRTGRRRWRDGAPSPARRSSGQPDRVARRGGGRSARRLASSVSIIGLPTRCTAGGGAALAGEVADRFGAGRQQQRRHRIGHAPVDLLGHRVVEAAQSRLDVRDPARRPCSRPVRPPASSSRPPYTTTRGDAIGGQFRLEALQQRRGLRGVRPPPPSPRPG